MAVRSAHDGAPEAFGAGAERLPVVVSISHSNDRALAAAAGAGIRLGCDLERVEPRPDVFARDFFTGRERAIVDAATRQDHDLVTTLLWSAKESALKAVRTGLRADTRSAEVDVEPRPAGVAWSPITVDVSDQDGSLEGWWTFRNGFVATVLADVAANPPDEI